MDETELVEPRWVASLEDFGSELWALQRESWDNTAESELVRLETLPWEESLMLAGRSSSKKKMLRMSMIKSKTTIEHLLTEATL